MSERLWNVSTIDILPMAAATAADERLGGPPMSQHAIVVVKKSYRPTGWKNKERKKERKIFCNCNNKIYVQPPSAAHIMYKL